MNRHHMDHFRDAKLLSDGEVLFEGFEGFIGCREKSAKRKEWHGYFLVGSCDHLECDRKYELVLQDGSKATIRASDLSDCQEGDGDRHAVEFYVVGDFRAAGRRHYGLDRGARPRLSN